MYYVHTYVIKHHIKIQGYISSVNPKFLQKVLVQSFCIEYMHIDMYVIKHHNKYQSDMPSHIREMAKESYLNIFLLNADWEPTPTHE